MILPEGLLFLLFAAISLLSAAIAVILTGVAQRIVRRRRATAPAMAEDPPSSSIPSPVASPIRYEFAGGRLMSPVAEDDPFLAPDIDTAFAPTALRETLATLHPDLPDRIGDLLSRGEPFRVLGYLGADALSVAGFVEKDVLVVSVAPALEGEGEALALAERQLSGMRRVLSLTSDAQWTETTDGRVVWCNEAYRTLCTEFDAFSVDRAPWPLVRVFGDQLDPPPTDGNQRRCHLVRNKPETTHWFEAQATRISDTEIMFCARPIDKLVVAETSLRDFVQTLSKTFATLPVGLAVFDRKRELVLFNPALVSVSMLDPSFLTRRPTLRAFLDQLRDNQRMPEPRDYRSWREEIALLEQGAAMDKYHEVWTLPTGETLRVTGRPHPNGAVAFLFEDISQEVSLTRRFRTDLELDRGILDDIPVGVVVFDRDGDVLRTNRPFRSLLQEQLGDMPDLLRSVERSGATLADMTRALQKIFLPSGLWGELRQFIRHDMDRAPWSDVVTDAGGLRVQCRIAPLRGGHTIVWMLPEAASWMDVLTDGVWLSQGEALIPDVLDSNLVEVRPSGEGAA